MEPDYELGMTEGRIRTSREMREYSGMLPLEKINSAIEGLEKSQAWLLEALDHPVDCGFGMTPEVIPDYLSNVMNELEIWQTQRSILLESIADVEEESFEEVSTKVSRLHYKETKLQCIEHLLERASTWKISSAYLPDPAKLAKYLSSIRGKPKAEDVLLDFWTQPHIRIEMAYLLFNAYCGDASSTISRDLFRQAIVKLLKNAAGHQLDSVQNTYPNLDLHVPFTPDVESALISLLWLATPSDDGVAQKQLTNCLPQRYTYLTEQCLQLWKSG
jgi:hypothetical protein